ncbi:MAG: class I SAM-dependent RNA methyltransferase [bacterium]|nr:class I SAM-dependent RNA methyltransferase [bacterium]
MTTAAELLAKADTLEAEIEKLVAGGDGLARYRGVPIFVPLSAPGDKLRLRVVERRSSYARAEIVEILEPGPDRRRAPCEHFENCGGCSLQHLEDEAQTRWKVGAAQETLERLGGVELNMPQNVIRGDSWHYRLRTQLQLDGEPGSASVGYFARGSHELVGVRACPVLVEPLEEFIVGLARRLDRRVPKRLDVALGDGGEITCGPVLPGLPKGAVRRRIGDHEYEYDSRTFFQAHAGLLPEFVDAVVGSDTGEAAYDLYAGVGLFSLPLARRYRRVVAVEGDRNALRYLRKNAQTARLTNVETIGSAVETWIGQLPERVDRVVVDPPRQGLSLHVRGVLKRLRPKRLTYVSCHPAALARDLKSLVKRYSLESLSYVDLFPQTGHLEIVARLCDPS